MELYKQEYSQVVTHLSIKLHLFKDVFKGQLCTV